MPPPWEFQPLPSYTIESYGMQRFCKVPLLGGGFKPNFSVSEE
ncbi:MAG: hypothetical protein VKL59_12970 [Nostocaceae cyanobacterium]|nr:hypothetical protein [Nostocaceae cyanobacterium]